MKYSIWRVLFFLFLLIGVAGIILILSISFFFYRYNTDAVLEHQVVMLEIVSNAIAGPYLTFREPMQAVSIENLFRETAKEQGIVFIRAINIKNNTIEISSDKKETGKKIDSPPLFERKVVVRDGLFDGKKIKEFSVKARDGTNLWLGFSLEHSRKNISLAAALLGFAISVLYFTIFLAIVLVFRRYIITPFLLLTDSFEKLKKEDYQTRLGDVPVKEIQNVFQSFNIMSQNLEESHEALRQKTNELRSRVEDLEKFQRLTVGRELKMIELKKEIQRLKEIKNKK